MPDEAPEGQPQDQDVATGMTSGPESEWWPWPEVDARDAVGPRDGAPGPDETLAFPVEAGAERIPQAASMVPEVLVRPVEVPQAKAVPELEAVAEPEAVRAGGAGELLPPAGTDGVGSIPAVSASHEWARHQWSNWRLYLVRLVSAGLSVLIAVALVPGLSFTAWRWGEGLEIALIFGLLNAFVKPLLQFISLRFLFSSYGIVIVLINTLLLMLLERIMDSIDAKSLLALLVGGALVGLIGGSLDSMLGANYPMLDRDYKERNGLT